MSAQSEKLTYTLDGKVAVLTFDDGKANAVSPDAIEAFHAALDRAESEARATLVVGRPGRFSAGFDLSLMTASDESARSLVAAGAELIARMYLHPQPLVVACTGHALAAGALIVLASDTRIGADGAFKIGLNEVAIGLRLPIFAVDLARDRLSKRHFTAAAIQGRVYAPGDARDAGYLDRVVAPEAVVEEALAEAKRQAELPTKALALTKQLARGAVVAHMRETLAADMAEVGVPSNAKKG
jgi:enoyl-CoA hydratase